MVTVLAWILVGGIAGWLASWLVRGTGLGLVGDLGVGILGAFLGGLLIALVAPDTDTFGFTSFNSFNAVSLVFAFVGAEVLVFLVRWRVAIRP